MARKPSSSSVDVDELWGKAKVQGTKPFSNSGLLALHILHPFEFPIVTINENNKRDKRRLILIQSSQSLQA